MNEYDIFVAKACFVAGVLLAVASVAVIAMVHP
jgi:hypothetical protein